VVKRTPPAKARQPPPRLGGQRRTPPPPLRPRPARVRPQHLPATRLPATSPELPASKPLRRPLHLGQCCQASAPPTPTASPERIH
jgi:hypothetical protein